MFLLVGCRRAAPKYCANMWWYIFFCVLYVQTIAVTTSNTTGVESGSKYIYAFRLVLEKTTAVVKYVTNFFYYFQYIA